MPNFNVFPCRLRELRTHQELTMQQLADSVQVTKGTIGNLENANKQPSVQMLISLADFFDVSLDYLVGRSNDPQRR